MVGVSFQSLLMPSGVNSPTLSYRGQTVITTNLTSYSFTSLDIGTASSNRRVFVAVHNQGAVVAGNPSSVTINGVSASMDGGLTSNSVRTSIWSVIVTSGTTGITIDVVFGSGMLNCGIGYWSAYNLRDASPLSAAQTSNAATANLSMTTESDCIILAAGTFDAGSAAFSGGAGCTERYDAPRETGFQCGGDASIFSGTNPATQTITYSGSSVQSSVAISWR